MLDSSVSPIPYRRMKVPRGSLAARASGRYRPRVPLRTALATCRTTGSDRRGRSNPGQCVPPAPINCTNPPGPAAAGDPAGPPRGRPGLSEPGTAPHPAFIPALDTAAPSPYPKPQLPSGRMQQTRRDRNPTPSPRPHPYSPAHHRCASTLASLQSTGPRPQPSTP
ncbi:hypothetical protein [Lysobacter gummosus]|uniref:hypothetical protein n=1 Tax=Lysobacter gummosus TaxID=262324 RepID=UPI00362DC6DB